MSMLFKFWPLCFISYCTKTILCDHQSTLLFAMAITRCALWWKYCLSLEMAYHPHVNCFALSCAVLYSIHPDPIWHPMASDVLPFHLVNKLKPLFDAYTGPYKDKHHYWTDLLLIHIGLFIMFSTNMSGDPLASYYHSYIICIKCGP